MWVLLMVLAVATAVILERVFYYFIYCRGDARAIAGTILKALAGGGVERARVFVAKGSTPPVRVLRAAVEHYEGDNVEEVRRAVEQAAIREVPRYSQRLNYLSLFANVATLLGLLGTIAGLQVSFGSLASADAAQKATLLAGGISQAMNTTAFGLIVAVPCMIAYTMLNNKQQALVRQMDEAVVTVLNAMDKGAVR
jgi:biopolymer transport protein ExbB/TolQ